MDTARLAAFVHATTALVSRRASLGAIFAAGLTALCGRSGSERVIARKKRRKKKKVKFNDFGCVDVGKVCKSDEQCCSGICVGTKGKKRCKGHDQSTCLAQDNICGGLETLCVTTTNQPGECVRTTGEASYCAGDGDCFPCATDADCVPFCGPQAACIVCADCLDPEGVQTVCAGLNEDDCTFPDPE